MRNFVIVICSFSPSVGPTLITVLVKRSLGPEHQVYLIIYGGSWIPPRSSEWRSTAARPRQTDLLTNVPNWSFRWFLSATWICLHARLVIMMRTRTLIQSPRLGETLMSEDTREIHWIASLPSLWPKRFDQIHKGLLGNVRDFAPLRLFLE